MMMAMMSFHAEKCCHLVSAHCTERLLSTCAASLKLQDNQ